MRIWISVREAYMPPVAIGEIMRAVGLGETVASRHPELKEGDLVFVAWP
jgi:NADPH-dependent curcumin reductase CurA